MNAIQLSSMLESMGIHTQARNFGISTGALHYSGEGPELISMSPVDDSEIARTGSASVADFNKAVEVARQASLYWRNVPAPKRGEVVRQIGEALRKHKEHLGKLVSYEMGKSYQEGLGEVQEMIDICDFATGLSRQLCGQTMHSERPSHRMYEQWHPLGIVGVISAFNFPVAVWAWNAAISWVCGNVCLWKPSEKTPLCAVACQNIVAEVFKQNQLPEGLSVVVQGGAMVGQQISEHSGIALVSATGSTAMGKAVATKVAARLGKSLLELGGNNAIIVSPEADLKLALMGVLFGAVGTAGQRCTSTRRVIIHHSVYDAFVNKLSAAYQQLRIGNPLDEKNHVGPLIDKAAVEMYLKTLAEAEQEGAKVIIAGGVLTGDEYLSGCYVKPAILEAKPNMKVVQHETFAPILYLMKYDRFEEAIAIQNEVPQGLSSAIFTNNLKEAEGFLSAQGSDCGIANVNIGTSGAEIGGAFGGEKETGGGRESGSDAWKAYMRRQTNTINYSDQLPLAQGITFELDE
jgi:aldehyde dehydrogenase (NAD+)